MTDAGLDLMATLDANLCFFGQHNDQGAIFQVDFYSKDLGGAPLLSKVYADWLNPSSGTLPPSAYWGSKVAVCNQPLESALVVEWDGGLGRTGKPVKFRKFYHAIPVSTAEDGGADITPTDVTGLQELANTIQTAFTDFDLLMGNTRRLAGTAEVSANYGNHQMPRGRRHKKLVTSSFKPGSYVVVSPPSE